MKRFVLGLLSALLLILSSGFTMYSHSCKGVVKYVGTEQLLSEVEGCSFCIMSGEQVDDNLNNCCEQETEVIKVKTEVQEASSKFQKITFFTEFILHNYFGAVFPLKEIQKLQLPTLSFNFPILWKVPLYIKHCVYRL